MKIVFILLGFSFQLHFAVGQVPEIYTGKKDCRCCGSNLFNYQKENNTTKMQEELTWISNNCRALSLNSESSPPPPIGEEIGTTPKPEPEPKPKETTTLINTSFGKGTGTTCPKWGVTQLGSHSGQTIDFSYCKVTKSMTPCNCATNSIQLLNINANVTSKVIAINKVRPQNVQSFLDQSNQISTWEDTDDNTESNYHFMAVTIEGNKIKVTKQGNNSEELYLSNSLQFNEKSEDLIKKLAILKFYDSNLRIITSPIDANLRAVIAGTYDSSPYWVGIDSNGGIFDPIDVKDLNTKKILIENREASFHLKKLMEKWYKTGVELKVVACVESNTTKLCHNPNEAWSNANSFSGDMSRATFLLSDGTSEGSNVGKIKADWYNRLPEDFKKNPYLAFMAVTDPDIKLLDTFSNGIVVLMGHSDNIYILKYLNNSTEPKVAVVISDMKKDLIIGEIVEIRANSTFYNENYQSTANTKYNNLK